MQPTVKTPLQPETSQLSLALSKGNEMNMPSQRLRNKLNQRNILAPRQLFSPAFRLHATLTVQLQICRADTSVATILSTNSQLERTTTEHINFSLCHNRSEYPITCQSRFHPLELSLAVVSCLADLIIVASLITRSHRAEFCCTTTQDGPSPCTMWTAAPPASAGTWAMCCRLHTSRGFRPLFSQLQIQSQV